MPLKNRALLKFPDFSFGLSYRLDERALCFRGVKNAMLNNKRLEKRYGIDFLIKDSSGDSPYFSAINSLSYFKNTNGNRFYFFKQGATLFRTDNDSTSFIALKGDLNADSKHRGVTLNNRHFVTLGNDGLFQFVGNIFTKAGAQQPSPATLSASGAGASLDASTWTLVYTLYSSTTGYESLPSSPSNAVTNTAGQFLTASALQSSSDNGTIDKIRIYIKKSSQVDYLFVAELPLGTTSLEIKNNPSSSQTPPDDTQLLPTGGAKYLTEFNSRLVVAGNTQFPNDIIFSNEDDPESFPDGETAIRLFISGDGPVTGIATGLYSNTVLDPFLVIFKENSTWVYSEIGDQAKLVQLNSNIGCVSHDSIIVRNGVVYFLSRYGWYAVSNGRLITKDNQPYSLGGGAVDDIFEDNSLAQYINRNQLNNAFSFYFQNQDIYVTFLADNGSNEFKKAYVYNFATDKFLKWEFPISLASAVVGEDSNGQETILLGQKNPASSITRPSVIFKMNKNNPYQDTYYAEGVDNPTKQSDAIDLNALMGWVDGDDYDASFNFRELILRLKRYQPNLTIKAWVNWTYSYNDSQEMELPEPDATFILDESFLDIDYLGEGNDAVTARVDLNVTGENLLIGLFQNTILENTIITSGQLNFSKNGNRNK